MRQSIIIAILLIIPVLGMTQSARKLLLEGDFFMGMDNYEEAEKNYAESSSKKATFKSYYNTGVSQEMQIQPTDQQTAGQAMQEPQDNPLQKKAILSYATATGLADNLADKAAAYFNLGNTHKADEQAMTIEKLESAIEAYKQSIQNDPTLNEARHNLAVTQVQLDQAKQQEQQEQQQQQDQEQQENEDQEQQEQNQDQQQDQEQQEQEQSEQEKQEEQQQNQEAKQQEQEEKEEVTKAEMEKILEMVEREDQEVQQKMRAKAQSSTEKTKKW